MANDTDFLLLLSVAATTCKAVPKVQVASYISRADVDKPGFLRADEERLALQRLSNTLARDGYAITAYEQKWFDSEGEAIDAAWWKTALTM